MGDVEEDKIVGQSFGENLPNVMDKANGPYFPSVKRSGLFGSKISKTSLG